MSLFFRKNGEWIYRAGVGLLLIAQLWLTQNFVGKSEFIEMNHAVAEIEKGMVRMEGINSVLLDHETRIRVLEKGFTTRDFMKRMSYHDWLDDKALKFSSINTQHEKDN